MRFCLILIILLLSRPSFAEGEASTPLPPADFGALKHTSSGRVERIIDGLTIALKNGKIVRLSSIDIPGISGPQDEQDIAFAAYQALEKLLPEGTDVKLYQTRNRKKGRVNRMNHQLAHIEIKDGERWVQGDLLKQGLARTMPSERNPEMSLQMYRLENSALIKNLGLWGADFFPVLAADPPPDKMIGAVHVVEGIVRKSATVKNNVYLNFGSNWKTDFTVMIKPAIRKKLARKGIDPLGLSGKRVRVRGWMREYNGPLIELAAPERLETLDSTHSQKEEETQTSNQ